MKKPSSEVKKTAKAILGALKRKFPGVKFRVIPHSVDIFINVTWSKGPTLAMVKAITSRYEKRIKYIVHARGYGNGKDIMGHQDFIKKVAQDICVLRGVEYSGRWDDAQAQRVLFLMDLSKGYHGVTLEDIGRPDSI